MLVVSKTVNPDRKILVGKQELLNNLKRKREDHKREYQEAMAGYKAAAMARLDEGYKKALADMERDYNEQRNKLAGLSDEEIKKQDDTFVLVRNHVVEMRVPRSYSDCYTLAIDIFTWDKSDTVELSVDDFMKYINDQWEWKDSFDTINSMYKSLPGVRH